MAKNKKRQGREQQGNLSIDSGLFYSPPAVGYRGPRDPGRPGWCGIPAGEKADEQGPDRLGINFTMPVAAMLL